MEVFRLLVLGIYREEVFFPEGLKTTGKSWMRRSSSCAGLGCNTRAVSLDEIDASMPAAGCVLTMAQSRRALSLLEALSAGGARVDQLAFRDIRMQADSSRTGA